MQFCVRVHPINPTDRQPAPVYLRLMAVKDHNWARFTFSNADNTCHTNMNPTLVAQEWRWPQPEQHTWDSLPTPLTGFRSVWPKALTASTATSRASPTAARGSMSGRFSMGVSMAVQKAPDNTRPPTHQAVGMRSSAVSCSWSSSISVLVL